MTVPADITDPAVLIARIARTVRRWRQEPALGHAQEIAFGLNLLPRAYLAGIFKRIELLASDVPGLTTAGVARRSRVTGYYDSVPPSAPRQRDADVLRRHVDIGVNIDTGAVNDPDKMIECLCEASTSAGAGGSPRRSRMVISRRRLPGGRDLRRRGVGRYDSAAKGMGTALLDDGKMRPPHGRAGARKTQD